MLDEILAFGEFIVAVPNAAASANIVGKISIGRDGRETGFGQKRLPLPRSSRTRKGRLFSFTFIDAGYGKEPCCELKTPQDETILRLYLRGNKETASEQFAEFSHKDSEFIKGSW